MKPVESIPLPVVIILCLTLGLAPFSPEPHVWQKAKMLVGGNLSRPVDVFDFILHGLPFILLGAKIVQIILSRKP